MLLVLTQISMSVHKSGLNSQLIQKITRVKCDYYELHKCLSVQQMDCISCTIRAYFTLSTWINFDSFYFLAPQTSCGFADWKLTRNARVNQPCHTGIFPPSFWLLSLIVGVAFWASGLWGIGRPFVPVQCTHWKYHHDSESEWGF